RSSNPQLDADLIYTPDVLDEYVAQGPLQLTDVTRQAALYESFFLGLRLAQGVDLKGLRANFGEIEEFNLLIAEFSSLGLMAREQNMVRLTPRGRLLSNEVFERFIVVS